MTFVYDFYLLNFILELNILSNHTEHPKKTSAILYTTFFYNSKISIPNKSANLFRK